MTTPETRRAYSAAHFLLELDDSEVAGFFRSVDGGGVKAEILTYQSGRDASLWRQLATPTHEDITIEVGMSMSDTFYRWLEGFFNGQVERKSGAIVAADFHYKERARREFEDALISELRFPSLDATDNSACTMGVTIVPERLRFARGEMRSLEPYIGSTTQKLWTPANFSFRLDGFEDACRRITKVEGFSIRQEIHEYHVGHLRESLRVPGMLEIPNLKFSLPEVDAWPIIDHFTKHVIEGQPQAAARHDGTIEMRDHHGDELCTITLGGVDIADVSPDKSDASSDEIKLVNVEIAVERMALSYARPD
jgi:phage tail-like protein